jgi:hypothetical protein|uniref:Uncharacterized protein n=1 Tax=viral metagenome TaxID=1070528 RepID=A0A6C0E029_9ZZZZ
MGKANGSRINAPKISKSKQKEDVMPQHALQFLKWLPAKYPNTPGLKEDIERFLRDPKVALRKQLKKE